MAKQQQGGSNSDESEEDGYVDDDVGKLKWSTEIFNLGESVSDPRVEDHASEDIKGILNNIQGCVKFIDVAQELHSMGRLVLLFHHFLYYPDGRIRARATKLVTTMVKNNPRSQQLVIEVNGLQPLLYNLISDPDPTSRTKALRAISALIRNNKPGITAFRLSNGYAALKEALDSKSVMLVRGVLKLILYLLHENSSYNNTLIELGFHHSMIYLAASIDDVEVREAALRALLVLAIDEEGGNNGHLVKNDDEVKTRLRHLIEAIIAKAPEDLDVTREEIQLMDSLWNVCYNEPSLLRLKGLLVLPGEDALAPDFASELFEPPLRGALAAAEVADRNSVSEEPDVVSKLVEPPLRGAWAAVEAADRNVVSEKKEAPLLLYTRVKGENKLKSVFRELKHVLHERKQVPQERIERIISAMNPEDLSATRVERHIVDTLWNACYNDDVVETVKDELGFDLYDYYDASQLFEPPLIAWAAARRNSVSEKKEAPLLKNVGVKNRAEPTFFTSTELNQPRSFFPVFRTAPNGCSVRCDAVRYCSTILFGFAKCIRFGR